ncbi:MAG: hypothetical protein Q9223_003602 [Gallowayella weberi]
MLGLSLYEQAVVIVFHRDQRLLNLYPLSPIEATAYVLFRLNEAEWDKAFERDPDYYDPQASLRELKYLDLDLGSYIYDEATDKASLRIQFKPSPQRQKSNRDMMKDIYTNGARHSLDLKTMLQVFWETVTTPHEMYGELPSEREIRMLWCEIRMLKSGSGF